MFMMMMMMMKYVHYISGSLHVQCRKCIW